MVHYSFVSKKITKNVKKKKKQQQQQQQQQKAKQERVKSHVGDVSFCKKLLQKSNIQRRTQKAN